MNDWMQDLEARQRAWERQQEADAREPFDDDLEAKFDQFLCVPRYAKVALCVAIAVIAGLLFWGCK